MNEALNGAAALALLLFAVLLPDMRARDAAHAAEIRRHIKDQAAIVPDSSRCVRATSQALLGPDMLDLYTVDVECCSGIPAGNQCYVTPRHKVFKW